jgi:Protein of unknown function (DUF2934)
VYINFAIQRAMVSSLKTVLFKERFFIPIPEVPMKQTSTMKRATANLSATNSSAPKNRFESPLEQTASSKESFNQKVAEKAYLLYVERGYADGFDVEDWLRAESIVRGL